MAIVEKKGLTHDEALRLTQTLEDVFTPDGDAGVIDQYDGFKAFIVGRNGRGWFELSDLTCMRRKGE